MITRIIFLRIKGFVNAILSQNQNALIRGRLIKYNIVVTHEISHSLLKNLKVGKDCLVVKLDISKAYDRLEWSFLEECLRADGFMERWLDKVMKCVKSVSYSFKINGVPSPKLVPQRSLRQGDPLSPYLFILAMDALTYMLKVTLDNSRMSGIRITPGAPILTYLFFLMILFFL